MGFSRQEYWSGLPLTSPGDLPNPGIEPGSPALRADALPSELPGKPLLDAEKRGLNTTGWGSHCFWLSQRVNVFMHLDISHTVTASSQG